MTKKKPQSQQAFELHEAGLTWREVGWALGITRTQAKNGGHYWRKKEQILAQQKEYYEANRAEILAKESVRRTKPESKARRQAWCDANRDRLRVQKRENTRKHAERTNKRRRERYRSDPEHRTKVLQRVDRYRAANLDLVRAKARERAARPEEKVRLKRYREENAEELAARRKRYRTANAEHTAKVQRAYRERNQERLRESGRKWREANRDKALLARSVWEHGPEWGPVHRALNDLKARLRAKQEGETP